MILAYIGPGPGLAIQAPLLVLLLALAAAAFSLLSFPWRYWRRRRRRCCPPKANRVVVVGLDGLEPTRVERLLAEGRLPNLKSLADLGGYQRLGTTCPPLSPVAWSSFSTGVNPGRHGIFGFVERDRDYQLRLTSAGIESRQARFGGLSMPWQRERPVFKRKSTSFWKTLAEAGVFTQVLRVPITWPPEKFPGFLLSAMGAPDLMGTQGSYTLFSRQERTLTHGDFCLLEEGADGTLSGFISGPKGSRLPLLMGLDWLRVGKQEVRLGLGEFTPWITLRFLQARGLVRFLKLDQDSLYMTPIQIDPARPASPISWPPLFSMALSSHCGPFATCGLAEDTGAREDGVLSDEAFLEQAYSIHEEREAQFFHLLEQAKEGCLIAVFDGPDRIQHMFSGDHQQEILDALYERMDRLVGKTMAGLDKETAVFVLSDHGFKPLRMLVDINAWLSQKGFLKAGDGQVDWGQSRAAVFNLSGIRLNVIGRESQGIVSRVECDELLGQIREGLRGLRYQNETVFQDVFLSQEIYQGPYREQAPDLVLGFAPGFGIYKDASRGLVSDLVFHANTSAWSGDHCFHPESVPGVLFCNRALRGGANIKDLSATILDLHGLDTPPWMEGRSLLMSLAAAEADQASPKGSEPDTIPTESEPDPASEGTDPSGGD